MQDSKRQPLAAPEYSGDVHRAAADGSGAVSPSVMPPHATLHHGVPVGAAAMPSSPMNIHQQGGSSTATELVREDFAHLSRDKAHNHKCKKGERLFSKGRKKHKNSAARYGHADPKPYHDSGSPSPNHKGLPKTSAEDIPAIPEQVFQDNFDAFPVRTCWTGDDDVAAPCYSRGTESRLLLPAIYGGKAMDDVFSDEARMSGKRPKKRHKHGAKHKHRHREPPETSQSPSADPESLLYDGVGIHQDQRVWTDDLRQFSAVKRSSKRHRRHHEKSSDGLPTTPGAIFKQREALFPDAADRSALRQEEIERRNQMLSRRPSMISRDFFLSGSNDTIDDVLQRQTAHLDQLAKISPEFSYLAHSRKYYMRSSRERSGMSTSDSTSLSSPRDSRATPDAPCEQSPGIKSLSDSKARSPDAVEGDVLPYTFSHGPVTSIMLPDTSSNLGPLDSVVSPEPQIGGTGLSVADPGRPDVSARTLTKRSKKERRTGDARARKAAHVANAVGAMCRGKRFGADRNLDSPLSPPAVQTAALGFRRKLSDETFAFVPDWSDRKVNEQSDVSRTLPFTQLGSHCGNVVPVSSHLSVAPAVSKETNRAPEVAHQSALSGGEQAISAELTVPILLPQKTKSTVLNEGAIPHSLLDVSQKIERDSEEGRLMSTKETETGHHVRDSRKTCPLALPYGHTGDPDSYVATADETALTEHLRDSAGDLVGHVDRKLLVLELPDQRPINAALEESKNMVHSVLEASQECTKGAIDMLETEDAPAKAKAATPPESAKRASLTIRTVPVPEKRHDAGEAALKTHPSNATAEDAKMSRSPDLAWRKKKAHSFLRRSLDKPRDRTASPTPPKTSLSPAAAMLPGKCRGSLDATTLYAVTPRASISKPHLWRELSAVMSRPVFVGISTPKMAGVIMLMDEEEIRTELDHVLPASNQVKLRELDISAAGKAGVHRS
ncbi:hypothetical protein HPB50_011700 [Hyalomma asiaticum]|uniref:Uncharacterized protein n=1 Tax=Hyalomma asiaticum TaxID=266040 RepID=A0ACB7SVN6_HYAAI|nr:hypothetical protein HPB50_011700 [Hyalomma asiaticum]